MARHTYLTLATPDEARKLWFDRLRAAERVLPEERVPLRRAFGRVLASPVAARRSSPAFHGAAMDGIAVRADATFAASARAPLRLEIGRDAFWINTGRPLPEGCNAVIMVEHVNVEEDGRYVVIEKPAFPWQHVRKMGEDIVATEIIMAQGTRIGPYELGALAAGGVTEAPVFVRPRVFIIPSGSEIVPLEEAREEDLRAGRVLPEFNSLVFSAMIEEAGGEPVVRPIVPDEPEAIAAALRAALEDTAYQPEPAADPSEKDLPLLADHSRCTGCGACMSGCPKDAITISGGRSHIDPDKCIRCGRCADACS